MVGRAMLTAVASSAAIPEPSTLTASTHRPDAEEYARSGASAAVMARAGSRVGGTGHPARHAEPVTPVAGDVTVSPWTWARPLAAVHVRKETRLAGRRVNGHHRILVIRPVLAMSGSVRSDVQARARRPGGRRFSGSVGRQNCSAYPR